MPSFVARSSVILTGLAGFLVSSAVGQISGHSTHHKVGVAEAKIGTPKSIAAEHHELHEVLARASRESGRLGLAAQELEKALAPHFRREEEIATPPLDSSPHWRGGSRPQKCAVFCR